MMADVDAVAAVAATGVKSDNPAPATPAQSADAKGAPAADWAMELPEDIKKQLAGRFKSPADLAKSYTALEQTLGKNIQDMTPEEREKILKRLGRPESPDAYELSNVTMPQGMVRDPEFDKGFRELVFKVQALPLKEQAKHYHEYFLQDATTKYAAMKANIAKVFDASETELRKTWGLDFDANMALSQKVAKIGGDEMVTWLNSGPGKLAVLRKWMYAIGKLMSDDTLESGTLVPKDTSGKPGLVFDAAKMGLSKVGSGSR